MNEPTKPPTPPPGYRLATEEDHQSIPNGAKVWLPLNQMWSAKLCNYGQALSAAIYAIPDAAPEPYWFCPRCNAEKPGSHVTNSEHCADCGTRVECRDDSTRAESAEVSRLKAEVEIGGQATKAWALVVEAKQMELDGYKRENDRLNSIFSSERQKREAVENRERVAIASWDEERMRTLREGERVVALRARNAELVALVGDLVDIAELHQITGESPYVAMLARADSLLSAPASEPTDTKGAQ